MSNLRTISADKTGDQIIYMNNTKQPLPYIGITGFKHITQVRKIREWMVDNQATLVDLDYLVMLGFTASNKRLENRHSEGKTSPSLENLASLCVWASVVRALPMIHYFTDKPANLAAEIITLFTDPEIGNLYEENLCRAIQINQDWPAVTQLQAVKAKLPELQIVVQLSPTALKLPDEEVVAKAKQYDGLADYMLIDPSGGMGVPLDLVRGAKLIGKLESTLPACRIGAAGGFSPENIAESYLALAGNNHWRFCVDAQGKLRTEGGELDPGKAIEYLEQATIATIAITRRAG